MSSSPPVVAEPAADVVPASVPCCHCGYDLRGQPVAAACPECGTPVGETLADRPLAPVGPARRTWARLVLGGLLILLLVTPRQIQTTMYMPFRDRVVLLLLYLRTLARDLLGDADPRAARHLGVATVLYTGLAVGACVMLSLKSDANPARDELPVQAFVACYGAAAVLCSLLVLGPTFRLIGATAALSWPTPGGVRSTRWPTNRTRPG